MTEICPGKQEYLRERFVDVPMFSDASDLSKTHAKTADGLAHAVPKAPQLHTENHAAYHQTKESLERSCWIQDPCVDFILFFHGELVSPRDRWIYLWEVTHAKTCRH